MQYIFMQRTEFTGLVSVTPFFTGSAHCINKRQQQPLHGPFWPSSFCRMAHRVGQPFPNASLLKAAW